MNIFTGVWSGLGEIWAHKMRSCLSLLSVFLGVASLIVIVGFINGLFTDWDFQMTEFGGVDMINVQVGPLPEKQQYLAKLSTGITLADAVSIQAVVPNLAAVDPEIQVPGNDLQANGEHFSVNIFGASPGVFIAKRYAVVAGRTLNNQDLVNHNTVVVICQPASKALFGTESPLGRNLSINGINFVIVGLLKNYSYKPDDYDLLEDKNNIVFVPITTCAGLFKGNNKLDTLDVKVSHVKELSDTVQEISNLLIHLHNGMKDFRVNTNVEDVESYNQITGGFYVAGFAIGSVTLMIGGVGIMNLMLASINERMREIGLRKALGARNSDIFFQVLTESIVLCTLGGLVGIGLGYSIIPLLQYFLLGSGFSPVFSWSSGVIGFVFSVVVGVVAGIYPAWQAARLDPIEALRYE